MKQIPVPSLSSTAPTMRRVTVALAAAALAVGAMPGNAGAEPPPGGGDTTAPKIQVSAPASPWEGWYAAPVTVTLSATDAGGLESLSYVLDGAQTGSGYSDGEALSVRIHSPGTTEIVIQATDLKGNRAARRYNVGIDLTNPSIDLGGTLTDGATVRQGATATLVFNCTDSPTGIADCRSNPVMASGAAVPAGSLGPQTITVTGRDFVGRSTSRTIRYEVVATPLDVVSGVTVTGRTGPGNAPRFGDELLASGAQFEPAAGDTTYTWLRGDQVVATGARYTVTAADVGSRLSARATGRRAGYGDTTTGTTIIGTVQRAPATVTGSLQVVGRLVEGTTVRVQDPTVTPAPTVVEYEWFIDGVSIPGVSGPSYTLRTSDIGKTLTCQAFYSSATRWNTVDCTGPAGSALGRVTGKALAVTVKPMVKGKARPGRTLRVTAPRFSSTPGKVSYQWLRNGKVIKGATKAKLKVRKAYRGKRISVRITAITAHRPATVTVTKAVRVKRR